MQNKKMDGMVRHFSQKKAAKFLTHFILMDNSTLTETNAKSLHFITLLRSLLRYRVKQQYSQLSRKNVKISKSTAAQTNNHMLLYITRTSFM